SKRICHPTSRPTVHPRSSAMRRDTARAATRRGCSSSTGPSAINAGGTLVVLPAPGWAVMTTARDRLTQSRISGRYESMGSDSTGGYAGRRTEVLRYRDGASSELRGRAEDPDGAGDAGAAETAIPGRILREVLLVVILGVVEL